MNQNQKPTKSEVEAAINLQTPLVIENSNNNSLIDLLNSNPTEKLVNVYVEKLEFEVGELKRVVYLGTSECETWNEEKGDLEKWLCHEFLVKQEQEVKTVYLACAQLDATYRMNRLLTNRAYVITFEGLVKSKKDPKKQYNSYIIQLVC